MARWNLTDEQWDALDELRFSTTDVAVFRDNGRFHRTRAVLDWLTAHRDQITVYWLPAYSPSLNLIERLWGHLKRTVLANVLYHTLDDLVAAFRHGARQLTGNRQRMGFMFNHDDLTQEMQRNSRRSAA